MCVAITDLRTGEVNGFKKFMVHKKCVNNLVLCLQDCGCMTAEERGKMEKKSHSCAGLPSVLT